MEIDHFCISWGKFFENIVIMGGCWQGKVEFLKNSLPKIQSKTETNFDMHKRN
jgi:hypothetical protein